MLKVENLHFLEYDIPIFEITKPGLYGFLGKNGAGKSTFFSILNKESFVEGATFSKSDVQYISSLESFDKNLSANDYFKILSTDELAKAIALSKKLGSDSFVNKKIGKYSLGMLQQVAIIISCAVDSDVIIFDEIHSGLDIKHLKIFFEILKEEKKDKIILLTSHRLEDVKENCDSTFFLENDIETVSDFSKIEDRLIGEL